MALIWADGFDHYGDTDALLITYPTANSATVKIGAAEYARTGTGCFASGFNGIGSSRLAVTVPQRHVYGVQFSTYIPAYLPASADVSIQGVQFRDPTGGPHCMVHFGCDGALWIWRGNYEEVLYKSEPGLLTPGAKQYWSVRVDVQPIPLPPTGFYDGTVEVRLGEGSNERRVVLLAGVNTESGGTAITGIISLGRYYDNPNVVWPIYYDDWIIWNTDGASNNDFMNSRRCRTVRLTGDDIAQDWHSHSGAPGWQELSHVPPSDTDFYVSSANNGDVSQFALANVPTNAIDVAAVFMHVQARKDVAAAVSINASLADANGNVAVAGNIALTNSIANYAVPILTAPDGSPLTAKKFNLSSARLTNES